MTLFPLIYTYRCFGIPCYIHLENSLIILLDPEALIIKLIRNLGNLINLDGVMLWKN
jgi:hypothetical protein